MDLTVSLESLLQKIEEDHVLEKMLSRFGQAIDDALEIVQQHAAPVLSEISIALDSATQRSIVQVEPALNAASIALDTLASSAYTRAEQTVRSVGSALGNANWRAPESGTIEAVLQNLDDRYQGFMRDRFDPLFGRARTQQLEEVTSNANFSEAEKSLNRKMAFTALALISVTVGVTLFPPLLWIAVPAAFTLTFPVYKKAYASVTKEHRVNYHVLSAINVTGIWLGGFYVPATISTFLYFLGEKLLLITQERSHQGLVNVFSQHPLRVWIALNGAEVEVPFDQLKRGDLTIVSAGQVMPVDGTIVEGMASIDQHMLTGEAQPKERAPGDTVYAATLVLSGRVVVHVDQTGEETVAARIGKILNQTASYQMALQSKGVVLAHASALPTLLLGGLAWATLSFESGLAILNSSFGINIRITAPIAMLNFLNIAARNLILIKDGRSLELLKRVDTVIFDKTGTLTLEQPTVASVHCCGRWRPDTVLTYAAAAEHHQPHPIGRAIVTEAQSRSLLWATIEDAKYQVGYGIKVWIGKRLIRVGSDRFMSMESIDVPPSIRAAQEQCHIHGNSLVMVAVGGKLAGAIELQPTLRPEAKEVISCLHRRNLSLVIISGDQEEPTRRLAGELGIDRYFANTLPEHKAKLVEQLQSEGAAVCFVGDGINDSIALKKASVSISLRGATTVATDTAQVVLMDETLNQLPHFFELADEFDRNLRIGFASAIIPGVINIGGVFLLNWGLYKAILIYNLGLATSVAIAMSPLLKHRTLKPLAAPVAVAREEEPRTVKDSMSSAQFAGD